MEIFMHNIPIGFDQYHIKALLAKHLHGPLFPNVKANFRVDLHHPRRGKKTLTGTFTLADLNVARRFLELYGSRDMIRSNRVINIGQNRVTFQKSFNLPSPEVINQLSRSRWVDPETEQEQRRESFKLYSSALPLQSIQFGWMCRDGVLSIESEVLQEQCFISFDPGRREIQVTVFSPPPSEQTHIIAIRQSSILKISVYRDKEVFGNAVVFLQLEIPPMFLCKDCPKGTSERLTTFPLANSIRTVPYTSQNILLTFASPYDTKRFFELATLAKVKYIQNDFIFSRRRNLFRELSPFEAKIKCFEWKVAFQLAALLHNSILNCTELLILLPLVDETLLTHGGDFTAELLKEFSLRIPHAQSKHNGSIPSCFNFLKEEPQQDSLQNTSPYRYAAATADATSQSRTDLDPDLCLSYHATITPTSILLDGPFLEKSNRVIRKFDSIHQECFLRVKLREEGGLHYRLDHDIDGRGFIHKRFGSFLKKGLIIAGRRFEFLAYSQSALKEHSVWFVKPFFDSKHGFVNASKIIESIGSFDNLPYDPDLMRCPARLGARISQAFTTTTPALVEINPDDICIKEDIKKRSGKYTYAFTDGCGGISEDLAKEIWLKIGPRSKVQDSNDFPHAYQIRFQGSKGMLPIDYRLKGKSALILRPSMIKFDAPVGEIEIARAITRPTPYHLNRPMIAIMEGLEIDFNVILRFQEQAVGETKQATQSLQDAANLLETHGLGTPFRLPSTMLNLFSKLGLTSIKGDPFYDQLLTVATYHILRNLKNQARIPIKNAWSLVGVADVDGCLGPDEIFACVKLPDGTTIYLDGHILISRSPMIHPGDIRIVNAVGKPRPGSCFEHEPLYNTVVFSTKGKRPIPSCLGGGDLDGDIYNLLPLNLHGCEFTPGVQFEPAAYPPSERKLLKKPSTMENIADFVLNYIVSDVVGIIANTWLMIADQSHFGVRDKVCLRLAELHSDAVDYPKTGQPIKISDIPKVKYPKPDWSAPETVDPDPVNYYKSESYIGRLFREIDLKEHEPSFLSPAVPRTSDFMNTTNHRREESSDSPSPPPPPTTNKSSINDLELLAAIKKLVSRYIPTSSCVPDISIKNIFRWYSRELASIASSCSPAYHHSKPLTEEELIVGTIAQKTSQPSLRKEKISKMRELTEILVHKVREYLDFDGSRSISDVLRIGWMAWLLSLEQVRKEIFGAKSFGWLALGAIFDVVKMFENAEEEEGDL